MEVGEVEVRARMCSWRGSGKMDFCNAESSCSG